MTGGITLRRGAGGYCIPVTPDPAEVFESVMDVWAQVADLSQSPEGLEMMKAAAEEYAAQVEHEE